MNFALINNSNTAFKCSGWITTFRNVLPSGNLHNSINFSAVIIFGTSIANLFALNRSKRIGFSILLLPSIDNGSDNYIAPVNESIDTAILRHSTTSKSIIKIFFILW